MNMIESYVLLLAASNHRLEELQNQRHTSPKTYPTELSMMIQEEDSLRKDMKYLVNEIDKEFNSFVENSWEWGAISGLPDLVLDIAARAAGARYVATRGVLVRIAVSPLLSFGKLVIEAVNTATELFNAEVRDTSRLKARLDLVYSTLNSLVAEEWNRKVNATTRV